jgi:acetyl-CoA synthetase
MTDLPDLYARIHHEFRWKVPSKFNIGVACARPSQAQENAVALIIDKPGEQVETWRCLALWRQSQKMANVLAAHGIIRGDRVAIVLAQRAETAISHIAAYICGAVAMPMSVLFGPEALAFRLSDAQAKLVIIEQEFLPNLHEALQLNLSSNTPQLLKHIVVVPSDPAAHLHSFTSTNLPANTDLQQHEWHSLMAKASDHFTPVKTSAVDAAVLIYTSGTTGPPKGALIPHQALIGNLTGFVASQNWFPKADDVFWSPADWAWTGGLMDALLPSLYFKRPIVGYRGRFSAQIAFELLEKHQVTNTFLFPTALKQMMKANPTPKKTHQLKVRAIMSAGESVGNTLFDWTAEALGVTVNEMFGQTEINYVVGNSALKWPAIAGSIGKAYPGHQVDVIDEDGQPVPDGELGEIAVNRFDVHGHPNPVFFLGYWQKQAATQSKYTGNWCRTGDLATRDNRGYLWYGGRADDMFKAAGYRIGPSEVENCLLKHPAVANVAVVPKPDAERGNIVKAFVVLTEGNLPSPALIAQLQLHVKGRLAPYEYPKEIEFIEKLPMTTTGKVQRRLLRT